MPRYFIDVDLRHTFYSTETMELEIDADNEQEAIILSRQKAYNDCDADPSDADLEESDIRDIIVRAIEDIPADIIPRCSKTVDMFNQ